LTKAKLEETYHQYSYKTKMKAIEIELT